MGRTPDFRVGGPARAIGAIQSSLQQHRAHSITRLWVLTGCSRHEIAELTLDEIDFERGLLVLADRKTGKSVRPLATAAIKLLNTIARSEDLDFVFPADRGKSHFQGTKTAWPKIVKKARLEGVTPHTLRHTLGAVATSSGEALALTGAILGHSNMRSTMIYAHVGMDSSKLAADRVGDQLAAALGTGAQTLSKGWSECFSDGRNHGDCISCIIYAEKHRVTVPVTIEAEIAVKFDELFSVLSSWRQYQVRYADLRTNISKNADDLTDHHFPQALAGKPFICGQPNKVHCWKMQARAKYPIFEAREIFDLFSNSA